MLLHRARQTPDHMYRSHLLHVESGRLLLSKARLHLTQLVQKLGKDFSTSMACADAVAARLATCAQIAFISDFSRMPRRR